MPSTVLVTGAAGFIGSHLCARLVSEGLTVRGLDDLSDGSLSNLDRVPEVDLTVGDLRSASTVDHVARECRIIYHQGAMRSVQRSMEDPLRTIQVNLGGTLNVLQAARNHKARVVFASSSSVYGDQDHGPLHEGLPLLPRSPYAASKLAGEAYAQSWWRIYGVPSISLRYFNVYGPRQDPVSEYALVIPRFILGCLQNLAIEIHGDGKQARDFTYIDDVIEANVRAARAGESAWGRAFNVGGGRPPTSIYDLFERITALTGTRPPLTYVDRRAGDVDRTQADPTLANALLGFRSRTDLDSGLARTVAWFRENSNPRIASS
jgi:nucleoside-diphosphate-sugar epimerase